MSLYLVYNYDIKILIKKTGKTFTKNGNEFVKISDNTINPMELVDDDKKLIIIEGPSSKVVKTLVSVEVKRYLNL